MRRLLILVGVALALVVCDEARASSPGPGRVDVARQMVGRSQPANFLGLALEYPTVPQWVTANSRVPGVDPVLVQLIRNLDPDGRPSLRIGGQSGDRWWWPTPGVRAPVGITQAITPPWVSAMRALASTLNAQLMLGLNLEANSQAITRYEAQHLVAGIGRKYIDSLQIGNEPDLYRTTPWYRLLDGKPIRWTKHAGTRVFNRPVGYGQLQFDDEVKALMPTLPDVPLSGPDAADAGWLNGYSQLVSRGGPIKMLDSHSYGLSDCVKDRTDPKFPSIPNMLALPTSRNILRHAAGFVGFAHARGMPFRIDEMGSVTCTGHRGVSDTVAAALWVTDALFTAARGGVDGVNLHTFPHSKNGLFDLSYDNGQWAADIHPLYYGALMFALADPAGARLLKITTGSAEQVRKWATIGVDHRVRVMLINVGGATSTVVHAPPGFGSYDASVVRMLTPGVAATTGLTIGGQSINAAGVLPTPTQEWTKPGAGGYRIALPADSETLVTLHYRGAATQRSR